MDMSLNFSFNEVTDNINFTSVNGESMSLINLCDCPLCGNCTVTILAVIVAFLLTIHAIYNHFRERISIWLYARNICTWWITEYNLDQDKEYDAFIAFSHLDDDFVLRKLLPQLESEPNPFRTFLLIRDFIAGEFIQDQIVKAIENSCRTIIVLSPNFLNSQWCRLEFRTAHAQAMFDGRARVIIILLGDVGDVSNLEPSLRAYLQMNTYLKADDPSFFDKLRYAMPHRRTP